VYPIHIDTLTRLRQSINDAFPVTRQLLCFYHISLYCKVSCRIIAPGMMTQIEQNRKSLRLLVQMKFVPMDATARQDQDESKENL
jgi:hypothetical protein